MNTNTNMNGNTDTNGKTFARVVFLMAQNPDTDMWEVMAYFPDIPWGDNRRNRASYMHNGQHGPCAEAFALLDCIAPRRQHLAAVGRLKKELEGIGYVLTVLDSGEWLKSHGERARELDDIVYNLTYKKDSELMMAANAATAEKRKAANA